MNQNEGNITEKSLKKKLGTLQILLYGVGTMLGAGIYVLVGKVAGYSGSFAPLSFLIAGVLAGLTAYSYAQLSPKFPKSGGEIEYVKAATGSKFLSAMVGWGVILTGFISASAIAKGFVGYLDVFILWPEWLVIFLVIGLLSSIAIWGIGESMLVIGLITVIEVLGLVFIILASGVSFSQISSSLSEMFLVPKQELISVFQGAFLAFYAFVGFEDLANIAEEAKSPRKSMPIALFGSLLIASILYILVAVVAVIALPQETLVDTKSPMAEILNSKGESFVFAISLISLIAVINGVLAQIIMGARVLLGLARQGSAPKFLNKIHAKFGTPISATMVMGVVVILLATWVPIVHLANATSYVIIGVFVLVNLSQLILVNREMKTSMLKSVKFWLPLFGFILSLAFLVLKTIIVT